MKKRSLVAALAMLMVSAIVLTSSTYAWFATGTTAKVSNISAKIANDSGSILISATGKTEDYKTSLDYTDFDFTGHGNFLLGENKNFVPVSFSPATGTIVTGSITQDTTPGSSTNGEYIFDNATSVVNSTGYFIKLTVFLKSDVDTKVNVSANMSQSSYSFMYSAIMESQTNYKVFNSAAKTYTPVVAATKGIDTQPNYIMDDGDTLDDGTSDYSGLGAAVVSTKDESLSVDLDAGTPKQLTVYIWAEGNDIACSGNVPEQACTVSLDFTKVA